jgi:ribonucleoside-diphosphate reductase alpha chain
VRPQCGWRADPAAARLRNCNVNTVAPTGTISIFADCSGGIEPLFAVAFMRNQAGALMPDVNRDFVATAKQQGWYSEDLMRRIAEEGHIHFDAVPAEVQRVFVTAHDVMPEWHIHTQAAFQEFVDSAISKTCNFAREATEEHVRKIYLMAYDLNCKGVTVYRDGSRPQQVLSTGKTTKEASGTSATAPPYRTSKRSWRTHASGCTATSIGSRSCAPARGCRSAAADASSQADASAITEGCDTPAAEPARRPVRHGQRR